MNSYHNGTYYQFFGRSSLVTLHNDVVYLVYVSPADSLGASPKLVAAFASREGAEEYVRPKLGDYMVRVQIREVKVEK